MERPVPPTRLTVCEAKTAEGWQNVRVEDAKRLLPGTLLRCPSCHGRVSAHGAFAADRYPYFAHRRPHDGCPYYTKRYSGTPSLHPEALF